MTLTISESYAGRTLCAYLFFISLATILLLVVFAAAVDSTDRAGCVEMSSQAGLGWRSAGSGWRGQSVARHANSPPCLHVCDYHQNGPP